MTWLWHIADHLRQGGWVMVPLLGVSLVMWTIIIDRFLEFRRLGRRDLANADTVEALTATAAPTGNGLRTTLVNRLRTTRKGTTAADRALLHITAAELGRRVDGGLRLAEVLVAVAPLLGLLGTVLGMIETFEVISVFGTGNPRALASGISVAMITTQSGLLVAIPGLFAVGRLRRAAATQKLRLEETVVVLDRALGAEAKS
ncbi:MotA/TolQ/ExbB proton channel family protein [bacterium]|nr:MAG: MotA/TolQ/ExbB proton channel family protein [bacterium]